MAPTFERLVREFLSAHPDLRHEWRQVPSWLAGDRLDLIFTSPAPDVPEVWATVREWTIAVGAGPDYHQDFEDFGRGCSDEAIARGLRPPPGSLGYPCLPPAGIGRP